MKNIVWRIISFALLSTLLIYKLDANANMAVLQRGYTPDVAGANLNETILTPSNVTATTFGRIFSLPVDGSIYAQPLYVPNLNVNGANHNVVFVATMKNIIYAFDADSLGAPLWEVNYSNTIPNATAVPITEYIGSNSLNIAGSVGIEGTPVIDPTSNTLYFVTNTLENSQIVFRLHAVDISSGAEKFGGSVIINGSVSYNGTTLNFNPTLQNQRTSLALANGQVIVSFSSHEDAYVYFGWIMSYNAATLNLNALMNTAPANYGAGVWQSGRPPVVDSNGFVYLFTGNAFSINSQITADGVNNFAESVLKLDPVTLKVIDYFTPANFQQLDIDDQDLSSSGPSLIPGSNVLIGGGKNGWLYLLNTQNLGQLQNNDNGSIQNINVSTGEIRGGTVIWSRSDAAGGTLVYNWGAGDSLKAFSYNAQTQNISHNPVTTFSGQPLLYPGGILAISANADQNGIVWASINSQGDTDHRVPPGELRALNAANPSQELWNSTLLAGRDDFGLWSKFVPPLVVNGKVYIATHSNQLVVYGLLATDGSATVTAWPPLKAAMGDTENFILSAWSSAGIPVAANWSVANLPTGVTAQFKVDNQGRNLLHLSLDGTTPPGSYRLNITANVSGNNTTQSVLLNVISSSEVIAVGAVVDSQMTNNTAENAIDQNIFTFWQTLDPIFFPHTITLDLGNIQPVTGLLYLPRHDGCVDGTALQYEVYLSPDNANWLQAAGGSFDYGPAWRSFGCDAQTFPQSQKISFPASYARYVRLNVLGAVIDGTPWLSASEVWAYTTNNNQPNITLNSSASSIGQNQTVSFTATVNGNQATGSVQFYANGVALQTPVTLNNGTATLTTSGFNTKGNYLITASYSGDSNNTSSTSSIFNLNVLNAGTIALSSSADTIVAGDNINLTATVSAVNPSGSIQFYLNGNALDTPVMLVNGIATLTTNELNEFGTDTITASYSGDQNNSPIDSSDPLIIIANVNPNNPVSQTVPALPWHFQLLMGMLLCITGIYIRNKRS